MASGVKCFTELILVGGESKKGWRRMCSHCNNQTFIKSWSNLREKIMMGWVCASFVNAFGCDVVGDDGGWDTGVGGFARAASSSRRRSILSSSVWILSYHVIVWCCSTQYCNISWRVTGYDRLINNINKLYLPMI